MNRLNSLVFASLVAAAVAMAATQTHAAAIHHWSFDTNGTDSIGGNTATASAASVTFGNAGGAFGGYMDDTNANAHAALNSAITLDSTSGAGTAWSLSFWINNWGSNMILGNTATNQQNSALWVRDEVQGGGGNDLRFQLFEASGNVSFEDFENDSVAGEWDHFALVRDDDGDYTSYFNGQAIVLNSQANDFVINALGAGASSHGNNYVGDLDEVWIFDHALTSQQVANLRNFNDINGEGNVIPTPAALPAGLAAMALLGARRRRA